MAYSLVVATPFGQYPEGAIITDPTAISAVRASEYFSAVVQVSDTIIPAPTPPPPALDLSAIQAAVASLNAAQTDIQNSLNNSLSITQQQQAALNAAIANLSAITAAQAASLNIAETVNQQQTAALQSALAQLNGLTTQVNSSQTTDQQQTQTITTQQNQINSLSALLSQLQGRVDSLATGGGGTVPTLPPELADDLPLAEADGDVLANAAGDILVGDAR